jgi:hypothetical protein
VRRPFADLFYMIHTMRSGRHHPDGVLWWRTGRHRLLPDRVPLTDIAPTVLDHFGVAAPAPMRGQSLFRVSGAEDRLRVELRTTGAACR